MTEFVDPNKSGTAVAPDDFEDLDVDDLYTTISFDPGGTTGWSVFAVYKEAIEDSEYSILDNVSFWTAGEFIGDERGQADEMIALVEAWPEAHIVIEDFVLRKFTSARELLSPVRITARFDQALHISGDARPMIIQPGVLAMKTVTDARLKRMGLWPPLQGSEHKRDAVRHNITWMKRAKQLFKRNAIADAMSGAKQ